VYKRQIDGYANKRFKPQANTTRAEAAKMLARVKALNERAIEITN
jgi:hypothetical protein